MTAPPIPYGLVAPRPPAEGPIRLESLVPGDGPLELDVGFGRGMSVIERARGAPESRVLGLEVKSKWVVKVAERLEREGLANARVYCADARELLARAEGAGVLARAFVHFPDPWWKKRHAKRRVVGPGFLDALARLIAPGGELFLQTDVEDRAASFVEDLVRARAFVLETPTGLVDENPFGARSNRERRAMADGLPVYRVLARRVTPAGDARSASCPR